MTRVPSQLSVDAAEHFYSESGLHGSSGRTLARKIGITLGAIIRHFGSKEDIVLEINRRYAIPINAERNAMLDAALKRSGGSPLPLKDIVAALVIPLSRPIVAHILRTGAIPQAFARLFSEPLAIRRRIYRELFIATVARIENELGRSLPDLSAAERRRRLNVAGNAMLGTFLRLDLIIEPECPSDFERAIRDCLQSLQDMTCAGLLAPAPDSAIRPDRRFGYRPHPPLRHHAHPQRLRLHPPLPQRRTEPLSPPPHAGVGAALARYGIRPYPPWCSGQPHLRRLSGSPGTGAVRTAHTGARRSTARKPTTPGPSFRRTRPDLAPDQSLERFNKAVAGYGFVFIHRFHRFTQMISGPSVEISGHNIS